MWQVANSLESVCELVSEWKVTFFIYLFFFLLFLTKEGTGTDIVVYRENVEKEEL